MINQFDNESLLPIQHIRMLLQVSDPTVWRWVRDGKFPQPVKRINRIRYWRAGDVKRWLDVE